MKNPSRTCVGTASIALACLLAFPLAVEAKDKFKRAGKHSVKHVVKGIPPGHQKVPPGHLKVPPGQLKKMVPPGYLGRVDESAWRAYSAYPRDRFAITQGTGYAGRGYYYGPPGVPYYYEDSGVRFWPTRSAVPQQYWRGGPVHRGYSTEASVQQALAQRGYYRGGIDGAIGPMSRAAIARFQAEQGLPATGIIDSMLLRALGL